MLLQLIVIVIDVAIYCYVHSDFAVGWGFEDPHGPDCVRSWTGLVVCLADRPVIWNSKLQSDIALSTMEAEYNTIYHVKWELLPFKHFVTTLYC